MKPIVLFAALCAVALQQPRYDTAPAISGKKWLNTEAKEFDWKTRAGKVTVVHFWTFACSNCKANLPAYAKVYTKFKDKGVDVIGIHTPELEIEKSDEGVSQAVDKYAIKYPVLIDTDGANWIRWKQQYWPTVYVVDGDGKIRFKWVGELGWQGQNGEQQLNDAIAKLLK
jgi:thiol-disulfide isomerase/thioredoxin